MRGTWAGLLLGIAAGFSYVVLPLLFGITMNGVGLAGFAGYERAVIGVEAVSVLLACAAVVLPSLTLQDRPGRGLPFAGLAAAFVVPAVLWILLDGAVDRALAPALAASSPVPFASFSAEWTRLGSVNGVPLALFLVAHERLYWRLRRQHFPRASLLEV